MQDELLEGSECTTTRPFSQGIAFGCRVSSDVQMANPALMQQRQGVRVLTRASKTHDEAAFSQGLQRKQMPFRFGARQVTSEPSARVIWDFVRRLIIRVIVCFLRSWTTTRKRSVNHGPSISVLSANNSSLTLTRIRERDRGVRVRTPAPRACACLSSDLLASRFRVERRL